MAQENGYWTKWLVAIISGAILSSFGLLVNYVIANDQCSRTRDEKIASELQDRVDKVNQEVSHKLDKMQMDITDIKIALARIK